jgi:hypothetical protein
MITIKKRNRTLNTIDYCVACAKLIPKYKNTYDITIGYVKFIICEKCMIKLDDKMIK